MTTAARTVAKPATRTQTASKPATQAAPEESHPGLWIMTGLIVSFAVTIAIAFWMAHTVQV